MKKYSFLLDNIDWLNECIDLSMKDRGIFTTILYWQSRKGLLTDEILSSCFGTKFDALSSGLQSKFIRAQNGSIYHKGLKDFLEQQERYCLKQRLNGSKGGRPASKPKQNPTLYPNKTQRFEELDISFANDDFKPLLHEWLEYKKSKGQRYKTGKSLKKFYEILVKYAEGNVGAAQEIISRSIANNYAGIFPLKNGKERIPTRSIPAKGKFDTQI